MRPLAFLFSLVPALALGQTALESAKPTMQVAAPSGSNNNWLPLLLVCAVLFGLYKWIGPKAMGWLGSKVSRTIDSELVVRESASIGQGHLYLVEIRGKELLVGATLHNISLITELPREELPTAFFEHLDEAVAAVEMPSTEIETPTPTQPADASDRLRDLINRLSA